MKKSSTLLFLFLYLGMAWSQEAQFSVDLSIDSLLLGNRTKVTFTLENARGSNFVAPDFTGFQIYSGPNQSSSVSMINGVVSQQQSFSYYLVAEEIGNYYIQPASIETEEGILETEPIEIIVVPNPDGIQQEESRTKRRRDFFNEYPLPQPTDPKKPRKKRRIYRI